MHLFSPSAKPPPVAPATQTVLLWNLRHGGSNTRTPEQALHLLEYQPDIIILAELRASRGSQLLTMLAEQGLMHHAIAPASSDRINRVAIVSREPLHSVASTSPRLLTARVGELTIIAAHIPDESNPRARADLWHGLLALAREHRDRPALIAGDFNTSRRGIDPARRGQTCERHMGTLCSLGYRDVWISAENPLPGTWSWAGPMGERHRLDGIFVSDQLHKCAENPVYDTTCVTQGLSDHAVFSVKIAPPRMWISHQNSPLPPESSL